MANLILSTDTTFIAIEKINNRLTGGTFDFSATTWIIYSGNNLTKRDDVFQNFIVDTGSTFNTLIGGSNNSGLTYSSYSTIFGGTGNSIDLFNNTIFVGEKNSISNVTNLISGQSNGANIIFAGIDNSISGNEILPSNSSVINGLQNYIYSLSASNYNNQGNSILNGMNNVIYGLGVENSWIANGTGNSINSLTNNLQNSFIFNGTNNSISGDSKNYNSIIGGGNNSIQDINNSIIIGSNLNALNDNTTYVNKLFFDKSILINNFTYSALTINSTFNHNDKSVCIIQNINTTTSNISVVLQNGSYIGQILYLIGIPNATLGNGWNTCNIILDDTNVIAKSTTIPFGGDFVLLNNLYYVFGVHGSINPIDYSALSIFIWDGTYWVRSDYRGGI